MSQVREFFKKRLMEIGHDALKEIKYYGIGYDDIVSSYEELGQKCPIYMRKGTRGFGDYGWGNGYVLIPKGHEYYGMGYEEIPYDAHGGLTFSEVIKADDSHNWPEGHWIGFDTAHLGDTKEKWPKDEVLKETINLFLQTVK